jgi:uncharacterized protein with PIN domain
VRKRGEPDPAAVALYRQYIERAGDEKGYKTYSCPNCDRLLWAKAEIIDPRTLEGDALRRAAEEHFKRWPTHRDIGLPDDEFGDYMERVQELGRKRRYETSRCPHCGKPLWSQSEILGAQL